MIFLLWLMNLIINYRITDKNIKINKYYFLDKDINYFSLNLHLNKILYFKHVRLFLFFVYKVDI